ncbi:dihydrodipicolinate synthase family protein [Arthrobacter ruber]|uniref:dihydrodipicolinate synthase family protein n=1 Tax=Arthrobacter ruber TaxID=1258893 RepID=UPI000CF44F44|nr:dihydrodipicolinate synthase family protein [Arthrobacter ruber]
MKLTSTEKGVYAIAPTPFLDDGSIDFPSIDRLVDFYQEAGVNGITVLGALGEAPKLTTEEAAAVADRFLTRAPFPVIVGVSAPGYAAMGGLAKKVMANGAAGVMIAPQPSLRTDDQIVNYYRGAAEAIGKDTPFVIQDFPLTFSVIMATDVIRRIAADNDNAVMLKHEDWPGLEKITQIRALEAAGKIPHLSILCGFGGAFLDFEVERGADGAMTGYCFPEMLVDVVRSSANGDRDAAHDLFDAHLPLIRYEQQPGAAGLSVRKYVLKRRGVLTSDAQRSPGGTLSTTATSEVEYLLNRLARHDPRAKLDS